MESKDGFNEERSDNDYSELMQSSGPKLLALFFFTNKRIYAEASALCYYEPMKSTTVILVDMDNVLVNFDKKTIQQIKAILPQAKPLYPKRHHHHIENDYAPMYRSAIRKIIETPGYYSDIEPIPGALTGTQELAKHAEVWICTSPLLSNPTCTNDKIAWVAEHLGKSWARRVIITKDKTFCKGDFLIDDAPTVEGVFTPTWEHLLYDQPYNNSQTKKRRIHWQNFEEVIFH